ncbi:MAG: hypothetical protein COA77_00190 [Thaumarchaeota archaeon]|nr:MAG: hypothetical protein COA77_00190 [Nitrososphaerota archaeon]
MGRLSIKWKISDLNYKNIPVPPEMIDDDMYYNDCYETGKKESKESNKEMKNKQKVEFSQQLQVLKARTPEYKSHWNKNGIIQFKNERIAILQRAWGGCSSRIYHCL